VADKDPASVVEQYRPPFVLTSDIVLVVALAPTGPLRRDFPGVPFLSLLTRTPLIVWFARITESCYHDTAGEFRCERGSGAEGLYSEVNVVALVRQRALFVPGIYASDAHTVHIARFYYGMPKHLERAAAHVGQREFLGELINGDQHSLVHARPVGAGRGLGAAMARLWPRWTWPVHFPSGRYVRALILEAPCVQLAWIRAGRLALHTAWLPTSVRFMPIGLSVRGLRMKLPLPASSTAADRLSVRRTP
jgi:hypothetical protein